MNNTNEEIIYNGVVEDTRPIEERAKDFNAKDLLVGSGKATFTPISSFDDIPLYQRRNQDGSGSCVAQSLAKLLEVLFKKNGFGEFKFSATPIYQKRSNKPESGMIGQNALDIVQKFFTALESMVVSENMNDSAMDSLPVDLQELAVFTKNFLGDRKVSFTYFTDYTPTFEEMTQYIEKYGGAIFFVRTDYQNWCKDEPTYSPDDKINIGHSTCGHFNAVYQDKEVFITDESWGQFSSSEMGVRGQRVITKEFFDNRAFFIGVLVLNKYEEKKVDYSKYVNLPKMNKGYEGQFAVQLQNMLEEYGSFPSNIPKYPRFGSQTAKALLQWQLENLTNIDRETLMSWGGNYFGNATIKKIKELANNNS